MIRILSLGAGVQSTTMALMAKEGLIGPMPDAAIFADTGWEPKAVYDHLEKLTEALPFPVVKVSEGSLRDDLISGLNSRGKNFASVPWFLKRPDGSSSMGKRQCTADYKLTPIRRKIVEMMGGKRPKGGAEVWVGISTDEAIRMKPSRVQYIVNRWPLIELRMNRSDCLAWLSRYGWSAPKSSCIGCPFHSNAQWKDLKENSPAEWADAVEVDRLIRDQPKMRGQQFMHRSLVPLDQVDLRSAAEVGQGDLFGNECEGMCGV